jgi:hypothetical protein
MRFLPTFRSRRNMQTIDTNIDKLINELAPEGTKFTVVRMNDVEPMSNEAYGPFDTFDEAMKWSMNRRQDFARPSRQHYEVLPLYPR